MRLVDSGDDGDGASPTPDDGDNDDTSLHTDNTTTYAIEVPLPENFFCKMCAPVPKWYKRHGDLAKHLKKYHAQKLAFKCRGCNEVYTTLKACNATR